MNYLNRHQFDLGAESQQDARISTESLRRKEQQIRQQRAMVIATDHNQAARLDHELAQVLLDLEQTMESWQLAFSALQHFIREHDWEQAVMACDTLFRLEHDDSLIALGHGLWLAITFPVDVGLTISQLQHVIDETPEDSDGAAVAAAMAAYVNELRGANQNASESTLVVGQMLNDVARRHGDVQEQTGFDQWFARLELDQPAKLTVRMRNIIDVLVQDQWWLNREQLQNLIPDGSE